MKMEKNPTFEKAILWQATTELRTATPRHFCQLLITIKGPSATWINMLPSSADSVHSADAVIRISPR